MTSPLTTTPMPTNTNGHHSVPQPRDSNTQLAHLLSEAYKQIDVLSQRVQDETRRAEHWEKIASQGTPDILSLQRSLHEAFCERDEERARRVAMTDQWQQLRDYLTLLDANSREARGLLDRLFQMDGGVVRDQRMEFPPIPLIDEVHRDRRHYRDAGRRKRKRSLSPSVDEMILEAADAPETHHNTEPFPQPPALSPSVSSISPVVGTARPSTGSFQTHIFAPVVTGAPIKRTKYTNTGHLSASNSNANASSLTRSDTLVTSTTDVSAVPAKIYPATNELGQRICRACGQPGRYKEEKCIEKWGPGPMGPGTVCDRCRKKIKRVERKSTLGSAPVPQLAGNNLPQVFKTYSGPVGAHAPQTPVHGAAVAPPPPPVENGAVTGIESGSVKASPTPSVVPPAQPRVIQSNASGSGSGTGSDVDGDADGDGDAEAEEEEAEADDVKEQLSTTTTTNDQPPVATLSNGHEGP